MAGESDGLRPAASRDTRVSGASGTGNGFGQGYVFQESATLDRRTEGSSTHLPMRNGEKCPGEGQDHDMHTVFIGNLPPWIDEPRIRQLTSQCGTVRNVHVRETKNNIRRKTFGRGQEFLEDHFYDSLLMASTPTPCYAWEKRRERRQGLLEDHFYGSLLILVWISKTKKILELLILWSVSYREATQAKISNSRIAASCIHHTSPPDISTSRSLRN